MNRFNTLLASLALLCSAIPASALEPKEYQDQDMPERVVILTGDSSHSRHLVAYLYDASDLHFSDPSAPRFLFLDRQGRVALGIGGYIKGSMLYDFDGAIDDGAYFIPHDIPVPQDPAQRSQFFGTANKSTLLLQLVGRSERFGYYQFYVQTDFTGSGKKKYGLRLRQAYMKMGYLLAGLASSTFVDGSAGTPTVEDQGPAGELSCKNVQVRYAPRFNKHFSGAIAIEVPDASYTLTDQTKKINQRVPDIPMYVQYEWGEGASHVRLSGILRNLSYRDILANKNRIATGWAAQLSGKICFTPALQFYFQGGIGAGYGQYVNDTQGFNFDLVPSSTVGKLKAQSMTNFELGLRYNVTKKFFMAAVYSQARLLSQGQLADDQYRYGQYLGVSGFYDIIPDLRFGMEYLRGQRSNFNHERAHANRITCMLQYSF